METKVIVFDFDNCIALNERTGEGSEEIKDRAWFEVFPECDPQKLDVIIEQVQQEIAGGKGDRKDIALRVLSHFDLVVEENMSDELARRCGRFDEVVQHGIRLLGISPTAVSTLNKLSEEYLLYINTATPRETILETLEAAGLTCFLGVYGRPGTKVSNLGDIASMEGICFGKMLFVGDMPGDRDAAKQVGCRFIGIRTKRNTEWHAPQPFLVLRSIAELKKVL